jgi:hypothetical protein
VIVQCAAGGDHNDCPPICGATLCGTHGLQSGLLSSRLASGLDKAGIRLANGWHAESYHYEWYTDDTKHSSLWVGIPDADHPQYEQGWDQLLVGWHLNVSDPGDYLTYRAWLIISGPAGVPHR